MLMQHSHKMVEQTDSLSRKVFFVELGSEGGTMGYQSCNPLWLIPQANVYVVLDEQV